MQVDSADGGSNTNKRCLADKLKQLVEEMPDPRCKLRKRGKGQARIAPMTKDSMLDDYPAEMNKKSNTHIDELVSMITT